MNQSFRRSKEKTNKRYDSFLMSERWEEFIKKWYVNNHISNLEYLDLLTTNPSNQELAHNLFVIYDKLCLSSKVHLKNFKLILEKLQEQEDKISRLESEVRTLSEKGQTSERRIEVRDTVTEEVNQRLKGIEKSIKELRKLVSG